jgi:hypothetical protein
MRKVDFFIVGAPKCGTTALNNYLSQHPQIFIPFRKEPLHYATDLLPEDDVFRPAEAYHALFEDARPDQVTGEASVYYLFSKLAARNMHAANPDARIIAMVRNPVEQIPSYHSQLLYTASEDIPDLEEALAAEEPRKRGQRLPAKPDRFPGKVYYRAMARYSEQLQRYLDVFPREQVHVIVYDDLKHDTPGVYRDTLRFLGVDPTFQAELKVINPNKRSRSRGMHTFVKNPAPVVKTLFSIFPAATRFRIKKVLLKLITKYEPRAPISPALRQQLQAEFAPEVDRLSELLGRDLSSWNQAK